MKHSSISSMEFRANGSCAGKMHQPHDSYRGDKSDLSQLKKPLASCLSETEKKAFGPEHTIKNS